MFGAHTDRRLAHSTDIAFHGHIHCRAGRGPLAPHGHRHAALPGHIADHAAIKSAAIHVETFEIAIAILRLRK